MEKAVDVAEKNMARFGLTQAEISNRRKWVMQTRKKVTAPTDQWSKRALCRRVHCMAVEVELLSISIECMKLRFFVIYAAAACHSQTLQFLSREYR